MKKYEDTCAQKVINYEGKLKSYQLGTSNYYDIILEMHELADIMNISIDCFHRILNRHWGSFQDAKFDKEQKQI